MSETLTGCAAASTDSTSRSTKVPVEISSVRPEPGKIALKAPRRTKPPKHIADFDMAQAAVQAAKEKGKQVRVGNLFSADLFYTPDFEMFDVMEKYGILGVEMEAAGIYGVAAEYGAKALCICTVSDHIRTHEQTTAEERQLTFNDMIEIALESVLIGDNA